MRVTRAAQRAQQGVEEPVETPEVSDRVLKDIEPNASPVAQEPLPVKTPAKTPAKKGKGKGAKKGAKGKKTKAQEEEDAPVLNEDDAQLNASAGDADQDRDLTQKHTGDAAQVSSNNEQPKVPQTPAVRLTRRQLAKLEEGALSQSQHAPSLCQPAEGVVEGATEQHVEQKIEEPNFKADKEAAAEGNSTSALQEEPTQIESRPATKPIRLTRRQQAKLEEGIKQSQQEQPPTLQPEPTDEEVLEAIVAEAKAEAVAQTDEQAFGEAAGDGSEGMQELAHIAAADGQSHPQVDVPAESGEAEEEAEVEALEEIGAVENQTADTTATGSGPANAEPTTLVETHIDTEQEASLEKAVPQEITPSVEIKSEPELKMLSAEKPYDRHMSTPAKSHTSNRRTSRSPSKSPMRIEESISAIDKLEEDLEDMGKAIPDFNHSEDEKSTRKPRFAKNAVTPIVEQNIPSKTTAKTPAKAPGRTPAKVASMTSSKGPIRAPVAAEAPPATRISRVPSAAPKSVKPTTSSLARASSVCTGPSKDIRKPSTDTAHCLASKRRPISLSFPTPPPPPKGRAPTKATFQLSSENVAAKLRAQKEERLKREAGGIAAPKQRPISMPPPPKSTKPSTVPSFQLPGEATAAKLKAQKEERLKRMEEAGGAEKLATRPISMPPPPKSTKQLTKPSFQLSGEATAARLKAQKEERLKRMEEAEAAKKAALSAPVRKPIAHRPREPVIPKNQSGVSIPPPPQSQAPQRSASLASQRSSIIGPSASRSTSTSSANRNSLLLTTGTKSTITPVDAAALKVKGKQVFNRDKIEKEERERERREKEEAAKKARAEAAERGRIASREWAERQRKKMMMGS